METKGTKNRPQWVEDIISKLEDDSVNLDEVCGKNDSLRNRFKGDCIEVNGKTLYADDMGGRLSKALDKGEIDSKDVFLIYDLLEKKMSK